jgi:hypothetical protein
MKYFLVFVGAALIALGQYGQHVQWMPIIGGIALDSAGILFGIEIGEARTHSKEIAGDFSSFLKECPVEGCGWYFQTDEMLQEHIKNNKHGV